MGEGGVEAGDAADGGGDTWWTPVKLGSTACGGGGGGGRDSISCVALEQKNVYRWGDTAFFCQTRWKKPGAAPIYD